MSKKDSPSYFFQNERVTFKSYVNEFTPELFREFNLRSEKIGLQKRIDDLFNGKKVNSSEGLAAWHTKYRNEYSEIKSDTPSNKGQESKLRDIYNLCISSKNIVTIGIGGSFEGPKMLLEYINFEDVDANFIFITGSDPSEFRKKTNKLNPKETIFIVSSKSFKTAETISTLNDAISWSNEMDRIVAITANKNEAKKYNIKNIIEFDKEIGGRYSIWSEISLLIYLFKKDEFDDFIAGGKQADIDLQKNDNYIRFIKNLSFSDIWLHNYKNKKSRAILSYIWRLRSFADYAQQLEMESLGKQPSKNSEYKNTGQIIFGGYGPRAQHSYFQLLHQGTQDICVDIILSNEDKKSLAYAQAITQSSLLSKGTSDLKGIERINGSVPINLFLMNKAGLYELGYLVATWEHRTFITASMLEINPFDQFGVNAGKIYTKKYLTEK